MTRQQRGARQLDLDDRASRPRPRAACRPRKCNSPRRIGSRRRWEGARSPRAAPPRRLWVPKTRARRRSFNPPAKISEVEAEHASTRIATGPVKAGKARIDREIELRIAHIHACPGAVPACPPNSRPCPWPFAPMPPGLPRRSTISAAAILRTSLTALSEALHDAREVQKHVEAHVAYFIEASRFEPHRRVRQIAEARQLPSRRGEIEIQRDLAPAPFRR